MTPPQKLLVLGPFSALQAGAVLEDPYNEFKLLWKNSRPNKRKSGKYCREITCHPMRHIFGETILRNSRKVCILEGTLYTWVMPPRNRRQEASRWCRTCISLLPPRDLHISTFWWRLPGTLWLVRPMCVGHSQNAGLQIWLLEMWAWTHLEALGVTVQWGVKFFDVIFNMSLFRSSRFGSN